MTARHELYVFRAFVYELFYRIYEPVFRYGIPLSATQSVILTVDAPQLTARKKNRAALTVRSQHRFFPKMQGSAPYDETVRRAAISPALASVSPARTGAQRALHLRLGLMSLI